MGGRVLFDVGIAEVLLDVGAGAEQALLFTSPEPDADGAAHLYTGGFENADGFKHDGGAGAVVGGACAGLPRIEVAAQHDDFVGLGFIGAGDFADDIERVEIFVVELVLDVDEHAYGDFLCEHAHDGAVIFVGYSDARRNRGIFLFVAATALLNEHGAIVTARGLDPGRYAFFHEELLDFEAEFALSAELRDAILLPWLRRGDLLRGHLGQLGVRVTVSLGLEAFGAFGNCGGENQLPFELALELGHILFFQHRSKDGVRGDRAVGARRPGFGVSDERKRMRGDNLHIGAFVGPAAAERSAPRFEMDVGELPFVQPLSGPFGGVFDVGGVCEAWAVDIGEVADNFHDLGSLRIEALFPDLMDRRQIGLANGRGLRSDRYDRQEQGQNCKDTRMLTHNLLRFGFR